MTTTERIKKLEKEVTELKSLFSALVPLDKEGEYKSTFIRHMVKVTSEKPVGRYEGAQSLLKIAR